MKTLIIKILKICLIFTLVLLAILLVFGIVLSLDWPWWVGIFLLLGLAGLFIGLLFIRKILLRRKEQRFVGQVIAQDDDRIKNVSKKEREELQDLQDRWKEAIGALRRSRLGKHGNPLYVLPWYMVFGESGSGKTTAIESARLSSPFAEVSSTSGISGTKNCDWWFFEQAIIVDTAGRYAIPIDEGRDRDEWQKFLNLLSKYRKKEPLNGLILCIAADRLLETSKENLEEDGQSIRLRIDELMRVLGAKFPIYVLVTKCDLIQGMTQFCDQFPEKRLDQAMGLINHKLSTDVEGFTSNCVKNIGERLRDLRLLLLERTNAQTLDPALLLFPEEFSRLETGLAAFIKGAFYQNPYQETPLMRGLFFSSGRQEGTPYSHFMKALDLIEDREVLPGTNKGLFLHDLFARILPRDRRLFAPTTHALEWQRLTRNLGLAAYVALALAICGLLSFSFVKNLRTLKEASREFAKPPILQGRILDDVVTMGRFQQTILKVGEQNRNWWIPRLGLGESKQVESALKDKYCNQFRDSFLALFDQEMESTMTKFSRVTPDKVIAQHVSHLVRRINLLKARLEGEKFDTLQVRPQPSYAPIVADADEAVLAEVKEMFGGLYLYYLTWRSDSHQMNAEMINLQEWLAHILNSKREDMHWLVAWANSQKTISPVALEDFWEGSVLLPRQVMVAPAFTRSGKEQIDSFIQEIEAALPDPGPPMIASQEMEFNSWYRKSFFASWHDFVANFDNGSYTLKGKDEWQQMAIKVAAGQGPYLTLLDRMAAELEPLASEGDSASWVDPLYQFQEIKIQAETQASGKDLGALAKVTKTGKKLVTKIAKVNKKMAKAQGAKITAQSELMAVNAYIDYQNALAEIAPDVKYGKMAYQAASEVYSEEAATSKSPFYKAHGAVEKLKALLAGGGSVEEVFGKLVTGPSRYLWYYTRQEAACHLQERWEQEVLAEVQGARNWQQLVLGKDGYATKFVKTGGPAAPFIEFRMKEGYRAKRKLGGTIPFEASFLAFIQKGRTAATATIENYRVTIKGLPTGANPGARRLPRLTSLELQCGNEVQSLLNRNYPIEKSFNWSSENCGDVVFKIEVGSVVLSKRYTGYLAFPKFLKDFREGRRKFHVDEFPEEKASLKRMGIKYIAVTYQLRGHEPVIRLLASGPRELPRNIVTCWPE
jgi:type VI secretion system protein ImpL